MPTLYTNSRCLDPLGAKDDDTDDDDYENMTPPYKDLPPKPGSFAPPRPPRAGKKTENPQLPLKSPKMAGLDLTPVPFMSPQLHVNPEPPALQSSPATDGTVMTTKLCPPSLGERPKGPFLTPHSIAVSLSATPTPPSTAASVPWHSQNLGCSGRCREERLTACLCPLVVASLLLSCIGLAVTLIKYQEVVEELRMLTFQQMAWQENVTGLAGLAGLKEDIDHVKADTSQSLMELRGLLDCARVTCPEGWLPFEGKCYYFSPIMKPWDGARIFCQENYSHLVIINSLAEQGSWLSTGVLAGAE
ncbi:C-type lectin domain family 17, member A [Choloepus didactylus]|uniref:C-type lectin domain family 17, member A n=1 Tax=Choloepus didactylus TaxID=27675 RepID=UPI0018A0A469|nr:C-type lectin domain family 17, member A [Choloepus didactylus]